MPCLVWPHPDSDENMHTARKPPSLIVLGYALDSPLIGIMCTLCMGYMHIHHRAIKLRDHCREQT